MKFWTTFTLLLCILPLYQVFAQKDTSITFLGINLASAPKEKAAYEQIAVRQNDAWYVALVKLDDGKTVMTGSFLDEKLKKSEGLFQYFDKGLLIMRGYYHNSNKVGVWKRWGTDSLLTDSIYFNPDGKAIIETKYDYHQNGQLYHYSRIDNDTKEKVTREYGGNGLLIGESHFINKNGDAVMYYPDGSLRSHSVFKDERVTSFVYIDQDGKKYNQKEYQQWIEKNARMDTLSHANPEYPGGDDAFFRTVKDGLKNAALVSRGGTTGASVTFTFYLDDGGKPYDIQIIGGDFAMSNTIAQVLQRMPAWIMHGRKKFGPITRSISFI